MKRFEIVNVYKKHAALRCVNGIHLKEKETKNRLNWRKEAEKRRGEGGDERVFCLFLFKFFRLAMFFHLSFRVFHLRNNKKSLYIDKFN